jgi:hypothetical protein
MVEQRDVHGAGGFTQLAGLWEATDYGKWTLALLGRKT